MAIVRQNNAEGLPSSGNVTTGNQGTASGDVLTPFITGSGSITAGSGGQAVRGTRSFIPDIAADGDNSFLYWQEPWTPAFSSRLERKGLNYGGGGTGGTPAVGDDFYQGIMGFFVGSASSPTWVADLRERSHLDSLVPHYSNYWQLRDSTGTVVWESGEISTAYPHWADWNGVNNSVATFELKIDAANGLAGVRVYNNYYSLTTPLVEVSGITGNFGASYSGQDVTSYFGKPAYIGSKVFSNGLGYDSLARSDTYAFIGTVDNPNVSVPATVGLVNTSVKQVLVTTGNLPITIALNDSRVVTLLEKVNTTPLANYGSTQRTVGIEFRANATVWAIGARYYKTASGASANWNGKSVQMALFDPNYANIIAQGSRTQLAGDATGWIDINWTEPVLLTAGVLYRVGVFIPGGDSTNSYPGFNSIGLTYPTPFTVSNPWQFDSIISYTVTPTISSPTWGGDSTKLYNIDVKVTNTAPPEVRKGITPWINKTQYNTYSSLGSRSFPPAVGGNRLILAILSLNGTNISISGWSEIVGLRKSYGEASLLVYTKTATEGESSVVISNPNTADMLVVVYEFPPWTIPNVATYADGPDSPPISAMISGMGGINQVFALVAHPPSPDSLPVLVTPQASTPYDENFISSWPQVGMLSISHAANFASSTSVVDAGVAPSSGSHTQRAFFALSNTVSTVSTLPVAAGLVATAKTVAKTTGSLPITVGLYHDSPQTMFEYFGVTTTIFNSDFNYRTVGTYFTANVDLWSTGMQYYVTTVLSSTHYAGKLLEGGLWDQSGNLIASGWVVGPSSPTASEFRDIFWSAPVKLKAGQSYMVGFRGPTVAALSNKRPYATSTAINSWTSHSNTLFSISASPTWNTAAIDDGTGVDYLVRPTSQFDTSTHNQLAPIDITGQRNYPDQSSKAWIRNTTGYTKTGINTSTITFQNAKVGNFLVAILSSTTATTMGSDWFQQASIIGQSELSVWTKTAVAEESSAVITQPGSGGAIAYQVLEFAAGSSWLLASGLSGAGLTDSMDISGLTGTTAVISATSMKLTNAYIGDTPTTLWNSPYVEMASIDATPFTTFDGVQLSTAINRNNFSSSSVPSSTTVSKYDLSREILNFALIVPTSAVTVPVDVGLVNTSVTPVVNSGTRTLPVTAGLVSTAVSTVAKTTGSLPVTVGLTRTSIKPVGISTGNVSANAGLVNNAAFQVRITSGTLSANVQLFGKGILATKGAVPFTVGLTATARIYQIKTTGSLPVNAKLQPGAAATIGKLPVAAGLATSSIRQIFKSTGALPVTVGVTSIAKPIVKARGTVRVDVTAVAGNVKPTSKTTGSFPVFVQITSEAAKIVATTGSLPLNVKLKSTVNMNGPRKVVSVSAKPIIDAKTYSRSVPPRG